MKAAPKQRRSRETLDRLLDAANREFAASGLHGVTTTAIAARAGVSVGSLYRFFDDKEAIAAAIVEAYLADAVEAYAPILGTLTEPNDLVPALRRLVHAAADLQRAHPGYYRITQDAPPQSEGAPAAVVRGQLVELFAAELDRLGVGESKAARRRVITLLIETVRHTLADADPDAPDRAEIVGELEALAVGYFATRLALDPNG
ncbi:MAG: TetR/AcrR family transcriptional regulator [Actinomycetota bacterium]